MIATRKKLYPAVLAVLENYASTCMDDAEDRRRLASALALAFNDIVHHPANQEPARKLRNEYKAMTDNLSATQHRSTQLMQALRAAYALANLGGAPPGVTGHEEDRAEVAAIRAVLDGKDWKDPDAPR